MLGRCEAIFTDAPAAPGPTRQCTALLPLMAQGPAGVERSPSKTATVVLVLPGRVSVLIAVAGTSVKYFSVTEAGPGLGFCSVRYSEKKLRVDPSAKFH